MGRHVSSEREILFHRKRSLGSVYYWPITLKGILVTIGIVVGFNALAWAVQTAGAWLHVPPGPLRLLAIVVGLSGIPLLLYIAHRHSAVAPEHW